MCSFCDVSRGRDIGRFRGRFPKAHSHAGDARGRGRVGFEQGRRDRKRPRDVVETPGRIVRRQQRGDIDLEIQKIADRVGVFGAVQTMEHDRARDWGGPRLLRSISASSQSRRPSYFARGGRGMPGGGIMPGAQFANHLLPNLGMVADGGQIQLLQRKIGRFGFVVVAPHAVLVEHGLRRRGCRSRRALLESGQRGGGQRSANKPVNKSPAFICAPRRRSDRGVARVRCFVFPGAFQPPSDEPRSGWRSGWTRN